MSSACCYAPCGSRRRGPGRLDLLALALVLLVWALVFPYNAALNNPNERTRVLQARALLEHGQLHVGEAFRDAGGTLRYRDLYGRAHRSPFVNDLALVCAGPEPQVGRCVGRLYPAKAPGTALIGLPALALARLLGLVPEGAAGELRATWVLRYGGVALAMVLGLLAAWSLLRRMEIPRPIARRGMMAAALGTAILPYAIMFVGHAVAGAALVGGLAALVSAADRRRRPHPRALAGGALTASAVLLEYHAVVAVACIGLWVLLSKERRRLLPGFVVGAGALLVLFLLLHQKMFGSPLKTGHFFLLSEHNRASQSTGFLGLDGLHPGSLRDHLLDPYMGLLPLMPWLVFGAAVGLPALFRGRVPGLPAGAARALAAIPLAYLLFTMTLGKWRVMNGWSIGPRYLVPALLPLSVVAVVGWGRLAASSPSLSRIIAGLAAASIVIVASLTAVFPQPPDSLANPFGELAVPLLLQGHGVRSVGGLLGLGSFSLLPWALWVALGAGWVLFGGDTEASAPGLRPRRRWLGALVAAAWVLSLAALRPTPERRAAEARAFVQRLDSRR